MDPKEAELYAKFLMEKKGATEDEAHGFIKQKFGVDLTPSLGTRAKEAGLSALHGLGRGLDYAGGNVRNAIAQGLDASGLTNITKEGDTAEALKGNAPTSSEYLDRYEPSGKGLPNTLTGLGVDIATDPLTYLTVGLAPLLKYGSKAADAGKLEKLAQGLKGLGESGAISKVDKGLAVAQNPLELLTPSAGKAIYKSAFAPTETKIAQEFVGNKTPISEILMKEGFTGNYTDALNKVKQLNSQAGRDIGAVVKSAEEKGISTGAEDVFKKSQESIDNLKSSMDPDIKALGEKMQEHLDQTVGNMGEAVTPEQALALKKQIDEKVNAKGWKLMEGGGAKDKVYQSMAMDLKNNAIQAPLEAADGGLYESLLKANKTFAATDRNVQKDLLREAKNASKRKTFSQVDSMLLGGGAFNPTVLGVLGAKKVGQAITSPVGKTNIGMAMMSPAMEQVNKYGLDPAARRVLINLLDEENK